MTKIVSRPNAKFKMEVVIEDGEEIGLIRKGRNTRSDTFPHQAMKLPDGTGPNEIIGTFYEEDGGRTAAINAIRENN